MVTNTDKTTTRGKVRRKKCAMARRGRCHTCSSPYTYPGLSYSTNSSGPYIPVLFPFPSPGQSVYLSLSLDFTELLCLLSLPKHCQLNLQKSTTIEQHIIGASDVTVTACATSKTQILLLCLQLVSRHS